MSDPNGKSTASAVVYRIHNVESYAEHGDQWPPTMQQPIEATGALNALFDRSACSVHTIARVTTSHRIETLTSGNSIKRSQMILPPMRAAIDNTARACINWR